MELAQAAALWMGTKIVINFVVYTAFFAYLLPKIFYQIAQKFQWKNKIHRTALIIFSALTVLYFLLPYYIAWQYDMEWHREAYSKFYIMTPLTDNYHYVLAKNMSWCFLVFLSGLYTLIFLGKTLGEKWWQRVIFWSLFGLDYILFAFSGVLIIMLGLVYFPI